MTIRHGSYTFPSLPSRSAFFNSSGRTFSIDFASPCVKKGADPKRSTLQKLEFKKQNCLEFSKTKKLEIGKKQKQIEMESLQHAKRNYACFRHLSSASFRCSPSPHELPVCRQKFFWTFSQLISTWKNKRGYIYLICILLIDLTSTASAKNIIAVYCSSHSAGLPVALHQQDRAFLPLPRRRQSEECRAIFEGKWRVGKHSKETIYIYNGGGGDKLFVQTTHNPLPCDDNGIW